MQSGPKKQHSFFRGVLSFFGVLLAAVLICVSIVTVLVSRTILNEKFMSGHLQESGVYEEVADAVKQSFLRLYKDSDYRDERLNEKMGTLADDSILPDTMEQQLSPVIRQTYRGKVPEYNAEKYAADYSDELYAKAQEQVPEMSRDSFNSILSDVISAIKEHVNLKDLGRIVKKYAALFKGQLRVPAILSTAAVLLLLILLLILIKQRLLWFRVYFLISGLIMVVLAALFWFWVPKDLLLINEAITKYVYSLLTWLTGTVVLSGLLHVLIGLLLHLLLRRRKKRAALAVS